MTERWERHTDLRRGSSSRASESSPHSECELHQQRRDEQPNQHGTQPRNQEDALPRGTHSECRCVCGETKRTLGKQKDEYGGCGTEYSAGDSKETFPGWAARNIRTGWLKPRLATGLISKIHCLSLDGLIGG
jgi:hypothetical protein